MRKRGFITILFKAKKLSSMIHVMLYPFCTVLRKRNCKLALEQKEYIIHRAPPNPIPVSMPYGILQDSKNDTKAKPVILILLLAAACSAQTLSRTPRCSRLIFPVPHKNVMIAQESDSEPSWPPIEIRPIIEEKRISSLSFSYSIRLFSLLTNVGSELVWVLKNFCLHCSSVGDSQLHPGFEASSGKQNLLKKNWPQAIDSWCLLSWYIG